MTDELEQLHNLELLLASEVLKICEKYNLKIVMLAGTFLGAIRHNGFIPWDDDMDFGMPREDFERFKELCVSDLDREKYFLQTDQTDLNYPFNFVKLRLNNTHVSEEFSLDANVHDGIYIDIFPIDDICPKPFRRFIQLKGFWLFRNLLWIKCGYGDNDRKKRLAYKLAKLATHVFSISFLKKMKEKCILLGQSTNADNVVVSDGSYGIKKKTFPKVWLDEVESYSFEDIKLWGMKNYKAYLKHMYGDYMQLPPENQRNHHKRIKIDFGPYVEK